MWVIFLPVENKSKVYDSSVVHVNCITGDDTKNSTKTCWESGSSLHVPVHSFAKLVKRMCAFVSKNSNVVDGTLSYENLKRIIY